MTSLLYNENQICNYVKSIIDSYLHADNQTVIFNNKYVLLNPFARLDQCTGYIRFMVDRGDFGFRRLIKPRLGEGGDE